MNESEAILAELRKIGAWADMQRKITKWSFIVIGALIPAMVIFGIVVENRLDRNLADLSPPAKPEKPAWSDVDWNIRRANLDEAIRIGEELIQRTPQYPEGHQRLAAAYLAAGTIEKAREHYAQAFHLFPSEENQKLLVAINRRITQGSPQPGAANGSQPIRSDTSSASGAAGSRR